MEILWLAIILYSIGLGLALHFRPALMFNENGTWKEFGYQRSSGDKSRHTLFPFWLFAITWAFLSYAVAASITWIIPAASVAATVMTDQADYTDSDYESPIVNVEKENNVPISETVRRGRGRPRKNPRPGYYVIDPESEQNGLRRYIYYGSQPPTDEV
jgi:hypothetical protein